MKETEQVRLTTSVPKGYATMTMQQLQTSLERQIEEGIYKKYGLWPNEYIYYLDSFVPDEMMNGEVPTAEVTITPVYIESATIGTPRIQPVLDRLLNTEPKEKTMTRRNATEYILKMHERAKKRMEELKKREDAHILEGRKIDAERTDIRNTCPHHETEKQTSLDTTEEYCLVCGARC